MTRDELVELAVERIARERVALRRLPTLAGVAFPETKAAANRLAGMVDLAVSLLGIDEDELVELVDERYIALTEQ